MATAVTEQQAITINPNALPQEYVPPVGFAKVQAIAQGVIKEGVKQYQAFKGNGLSDCGAFMRRHWPTALLITATIVAASLTQGSPANPQPTPTPEPEHTFTAIIHDHPGAALGSGAGLFSALTAITVIAMRSLAGVTP